LNAAIRPAVLDPRTVRGLTRNPAVIIMPPSTMERFYKFVDTLKPYDPRVFVISKRRLRNICNTNGFCYLHLFSWSNRRAMLYKFGRFPTAVKVAEKQKLFHNHIAKFSLRVSTSPDIHVQRNIEGIAISRLQYFAHRAVGGERLGIEQLMGRRASMDR
jgi:hypothetical protein